MTRKCSRSCRTATQDNGSCVQGIEMFVHTTIYAEFYRDYVHGKLSKENEVKKVFFCRKNGCHSEDLQKRRETHKNKITTHRQHHHPLNMTLSPNRNRADTQFNRESRSNIVKQRKAKIK